MDQLIERICPSEDDGIRADVFLAANTDLSRSRAAALISDGCVKIDGVMELKPSARLAAGQKVEISLPESKPVSIEPQNIPLDIIYQDSDIVIVNKPHGMVVHPAVGNEDRTLVNALLYHVKDLSGIGGEIRPGIVHRLDKDTSGLILIAKHDRSHMLMSEQFKARTMEKHYRAVAYGNFSEESGLIDAPIGRHPIDRKKMAIVPNGKPSQTEWAVLERMKGCTYLDVHLLTGRTHQIRVHMQSIGHPLLGDRIYAPNIKTSVHIPRLMLHAYSLSFDHPATGERMTFTAPLPEKYTATLEKLG